MTINKLYSKKFILIKLIFVILLPLFIQLTAMLFDSDNAFVYVLVTVFSLGLLYAMPFLITLKALRKELINKKADINLKEIIFYDFGFLLFPAIISTVLCDAIFTIFNGDTKGQGFFSIIIIIIITLITLVFWLLYFLFRKKR